MTARQHKVGGKREKAAPLAAAFFLFPFSLMLASGCHSTDRLEQELRHKEGELDEVRGELYKTEAFNQALERQLQDIHQAPCVPPGACAKPSDIGYLTAGVKEIVLGRQTGGYDDDRIPGDEALQVVVEPRDGDGSAIKAPGALRVAAFQITSQGLKLPLSAWDVPPEDLRRTWKSGLLNTGYYVILPWKVWPSTAKLRVVAQLILIDGRVFEADKDVTIRLPPEACRKPLPPATEAMPEAIPAPRPDLVPRPVPIPPKDGPELKQSSGYPPATAEPYHVSASQRLSEAVHVLKPVPVN
jgi:hypothetical protein